MKRNRELKNIRLVETGSVLEVILSRPEIRNAFNPQMIAEITEIFIEVNLRTDLRAVVLRGEGNVFCAGADLAWMKEMVGYSLAKNRKDSEKLFEMFVAIESCLHPLIGVVHGAAFGGALGLLACCDIVIVEEQTQLCFSEVKLGLVPAVISYFILQKVPRQLIAAWMLLGRVFTAAEAVKVGLAHVTAPENQLEYTKNALIQQLLENGPEAIRDTKKLLLMSSHWDKKEAKAAVTAVIAQRRISAEGQEGLQAFFEKRAPRWKIKAKEIAKGNTNGNAYEKATKGTLK